MLPNSVELAHDLRMPLQLIASSAQMLKLSLTDDTVDAGTYIDLLMASVGQMDRLLDGALESCHRAERELTPRLVDGDIAACLRRLCLRCQAYARERGVRLCCGGNVAALNMAIDEDMLSRILLNLISNALRHTPRGGRVWVRWTALGDFVEITVSDTGEGIPRERQGYIFLAGESDGGHGYGLPIASRLARALGGELTVASAPGQGSAFTLRLPVRAARAV